MKFVVFLFAALMASPALAQGVDDVVSCVSNAECVQSTGKSGTCVSGSCACSTGYRKVANTEYCLWIGGDASQVNNTFMVSMVFPNVACNNNKATNELVLEILDKVFEGAHASITIAFMFCDRSGVTVSTTVEVNLFAASAVFADFSTTLSGILAEDSPVLVTQRAAQPADTPAADIINTNRTSVFGSTVTTSLLNSVNHTCATTPGVLTSFPLDDRCHALTCADDYNRVLNRSLTEEWLRHYTCVEEAGPLEDGEIVGIVFGCLAGFILIAVVVYFGIVNSGATPQENGGDEESGDVLKGEKNVEEDEKPVDVSNEPIEQEPVKEQEHTVSVKGSTRNEPFTEGDESSHEVIV
eukprot:TRINITY_DN11486_c1_g1_i1.p1 TRINITY_DN11486_c1_g1~~TRINITY_DN11486_c1_g1_i1.p1  ORF type:complete len:354 (+),score=69.05 TRINITY_DN11486_c1_g1_i1:44-1105(+)